MPNPEFRAMFTAAEHPIQRFDVAHIVYNRFDRAESILRGPKAILRSDRPLYSATDYSVVHVCPVKDEVLCAEHG